METNNQECQVNQPTRILKTSTSKYLMDVTPSLADIFIKVSLLFLRMQLHFYKNCSKNKNFQTEVNGLPELYNAPNLGMKCVWTLILFTVVCLLVFCCKTQLREFHENPVLTSINVETGMKGHTRPEILICPSKKIYYSLNNIPNHKQVDEDYINTLCHTSFLDEIDTASKCVCFISH